MTLVDGIKLSQADLAVLPFEKKLSSNGHTMHLYARASVEALARQKARERGITLANPSTSYGPRIMRAPTPPYEENPRHTPNPPTKKIRNYTPPEPQDPRDPPPQEIIWNGGPVNTNVERDDARVLYLVRFLPGGLAVYALMSFQAYKFRIGTVA